MKILLSVLYSVFLQESESTQEYRLKLNPDTGRIYWIRWTLFAVLSLSASLFHTHTHTHYQDEIDQALIYTSQFHSPPPSPRLQRTTFSCRERLSSAAPIGKFPAKFCNSERGSCFSADEVRFGHAGLALPSTIWAVIHSVTCYPGPCFKPGDTKRKFLTFDLMFHQKVILIQGW